MPLETLPPEHARQTWETIVGHALAKESLQRALAENRLPHGILLHGPDQVGKTALAVAATKHLLAGEWPPESDEAKRAAAKVQRSTHPDIMYVRPDMRAGKALQIKVEDVREVERLAPLTPIEGAWRVVIIDGADRMNVSTANSLLKVLEEPPAHCKFFLTAHRRAALLPTIISRCTPLRLGPVSASELTEWLVRDKGMSRDQARLAARWSEGRPGAAASLPLADWENRLAAVTDILTHFITRDYSGVFKAAADLLTLGEAARLEGESALAAALRWMRLWLRDRLVLQTAPNRPDLLAREGMQARDGWTIETLTALGDEIERLWPFAERMIDAGLALETLLTNVGAAKSKKVDGAARPSAVS